jgi:hypothetical protein
MKFFKIIIVISLLFVNLCLISQNINPVDVKYFDVFASTDNIDLAQSSKLESFVENWVGINKKRRGFYGYRVKIFSELGTSARSNANSLRLECKNKYPGVPVYVVYREPNFEVHVGDFRTKFEAMALLEQLKPKYGEAFVVYEIIDFPELKD